MYDCGQTTNAIARSDLISQKWNFGLRNGFRLINKRGCGMLSCKHNVVVLCTVFSFYHAVFVNTQVNEICLLLYPAQLETANELHIVVFPSVSVCPTH